MMGTVSNQTTPLFSRLVKALAPGWCAIARFDGTSIVFWGFLLVRLSASAAHRFERACFEMGGSEGPFGKAV